MNKTSEEWLHADFQPHDVVRVDFDAEDIQRAYEIAQKKVFHTKVYDPSGIAREHKVMLVRIVAGELADQAVTSVINDFYQRASSHCRAVEYDDVRQDSFRDTAPYSIQIERNGGVEKTVEVRSSFSYRLPDPRMMISKLSSYGWYTSYGKPIEDPKDYYFQVFYHLRPESVQKEPNWPDVSVFEECLAQGMVTAYVVGGADYNLLHTSGTTKRNDADGALYQAIFPSNQGYDVETMLSLLPH